MELAKIMIHAGAHRHRWCPVSVEIPEHVVEKSSLQLLLDNRPVEFQLLPTDNGAAKLAWIIDSLPLKGERIYLLCTAETEAPVEESQNVEIVQKSVGKLDVLLDGEGFSTYNYGSDVVRPFFYPIYAEASLGITRNWPMVEGVPGETDDHPHHKGLYTAQGEVNGIDNWGEGDGSQIHKKFVETYVGSICGGFAEELDWVDSVGAPNMAETRRVTIYRQAPGIRLVDYDVTLHASHGKVVLGDTKEAGLLSVRVASTMDALNNEGGTITNAFGGIQEPETWGKHSPWCDYSGPVGNGCYGICMMDHPDNPRHPTPWHVRDYGLMTANCFGFRHFTGNPDNRHDLIIEAGQSQTWKYRILIHAGDARDASVSDHYLNYAFPPAVETDIC